MLIYTCRLVWIRTGVSLSSKSYSQSAPTAGTLSPNTVAALVLLRTRRVLEQRWWGSTKQPHTAQATERGGRGTTSAAAQQVTTLHCSCKQPDLLFKKCILVKDQSGQLD